MTRYSTVLVGVAALLVISCARSRPAPAVAPDDDAMRTTRTLYLGSFGVSADALLARAQMREELQRQERFMIVDSEQEADAVLTGEIAVQRPASGRLRDYRAFGELRLVRTRPTRILWRHVYDPLVVDAPSDDIAPPERIHRMVLQFSERLHRVAPE